MSKPSLRERLVALRAKKAGLVKEAAAENKIRVAASWTVSKTLLPGAPTEIQKKFAASILNLDLAILKSAVKQAAVNSFWSKFAEDMESCGAPLNKFVEDEAMLNKLKKEVERELKGEPKNASDKKADYLPPEDKQAELDAEEKVDLHEKIENTEQSVHDLEHAIMDEEGSELDLSRVFDETDGKVDDLANEGGEEDFDMDMGLDEELGMPGEEDLHGPSDTSGLEEDLEGNPKEGMSEAADYFSHASEDEDMDDDFLKDASDTDTEAGDMADFFGNSAVGDAQDVDEDHNDLIGDLMSSIKPETFKTDRETEPHFEQPKAASKTPSPKKKSARPLRSLGHVSLDEKEQSQLSRLVFPDDDEF